MTYGCMKFKDINVESNMRWHALCYLMDLLYKLKVTQEDITYQTDFINFICKMEALTGIDPVSPG